MQKDKIKTISFLKLLSFYYFRFPEKLRTFEIFFAILLNKILFDNRKGVFYLYQKRKR